MSDKRCILCNDTGIMKLISGWYKCYCVSAKEMREQK